MSIHVGEETNPQPWSEREIQLLNSAVEKIMRIGEQVGVTPDEMIALLDAGFSIRELLLFILSKRSGHEA